MFELSERPLQCQGRVDECVSIVVGVEDEVVADFYLGADAEVDVLQAWEGVEVVPELGFGEKDELSVAVGVLATPEVDEA